MKKLTAKQYYSIQSELDYVIDNENVADMKVQEQLNEETTLYALDDDADQVMVSNLSGDLFYLNTTIQEVKKLYA